MTDKKIYARAFEIQFASETVHVWTGNVNRTLYDSSVHIGLYGNMTVPSIPFSSNGDNDTATFEVSGLSADFEEMMWDEKNEVVGNKIIERAIFLNTDLSFYDAKLAQVYLMQGVQSQRQPADDGQPQYTLSIMVETLFAGRSEAGFGRYTQSDQIGRGHTNDRMMNMVPTLAQGIKFQLA